MNNEFPKFRNIEISDRSFFESFTVNFPPYSDYNFASIFAWSTNDESQFSILNGNLVVRFNDYLTSAPFYSFIGDNKAIETTETLLEHAQKEGTAPYLKLVPEISIRSLSNSPNLKIEEDPDNFDYIFDIPEYVELKGKKYATKRNFINRFRNKYTYVDRVINPEDPQTKVSVLKTFDNWTQSRGKDEGDVEIEANAILRALEYARELELLIVGSFIDDRMVGFSINQVIQHGYAINLFEKADISYPGVFPHIRNIACSYLLKNGAYLLNFEQDLGIEGLRISKLSYHPTNFLKKYVIS